MTATAIVLACCAFVLGYWFRGLGINAAHRRALADIAQAYRDATEDSSRYADRERGQFNP